MRRRALLRALAAIVPVTAAGLARPTRLFAEEASGEAVSVDTLPALSGTLTLYLGRGEGGLYENIIAAIEKRNPALELKVRRGPSTALANTLVAEARAGRVRADLFWSIDAGSIGLVARNAEPAAVPEALKQTLQREFRYEHWVPVSGRFRTVPYNPTTVNAADLPDDVMALPETDARFGWAPAYGAFQSFVTAMRLLEGEDATGAWLEAMAPKARDFAGEFGVVMAVSRNEVDLGFANHYYTLRLKQGRPDASVDLAYTRNDAGCLLNASGIVMLRRSELATDFVRHLLTAEVQSYLAREAYEVPLVAGVPNPEGLPPTSELQPPRIDLERLGDLQPTLKLLRRTGVL